jgi:superfamily II DNA or RNA helicase
LQNDRARIGNMVQYYEKYARGLPAIAFGTSIADSESIAGLFTEAGYSMTAIHSKMLGSVQDTLDAARAGKLSYISSCDMVGEGVSVNGLTVEIDGRPTDSLVVKLQHSGRVLRAVYAPGYDLSTLAGRRAAMQAGGKGKAQILDFSSNYLRHGLPDDERVWSLKGEVKQSTSSAYKRCPSCQRPVPSFARVCPHCAYEWPVMAPEQSAGPEEVDGELVPISELAVSDKSALAVRIAREAHDLRSAIRIARECGANHQAAFYVWHIVLKKPVKNRK